MLTSSNLNLIFKQNLLILNLKTNKKRQFDPYKWHSRKV